MLNFICDPDLEFVENENPSVALQEQLNSHGEFKLKPNGTMELEHFFIFYSIIKRQAERLFLP